MMTETPPTHFHGIVICGEASESDDEIDSRSISKAQPMGNVSGDQFEPQSQSAEALEQSDFEKSGEQAKHDTLLHKKLRERNQSLRKSLIDIACQPYQSASKEIHSISQQLIKSQFLVQEITSTLQKLTKELYVLEDKVQYMRSGSFLPDVDVNAEASNSRP